MKITGGRVDRFIKKPDDDTIGVLFFGPDQGLCSERAAVLAKSFSSDPNDPFSVTQLSADDLIGDPAKLSDEMSAMSLLGDTRVIRLRLSHERGAAALSKTIKALDAAPHLCAAKLIIEAGDMATRSSVRKTFEAAKHFAAIACYEASQADLSQLVRSEFDAAGLSIERSALDALIPLLHGDRRMARSEIEKLALYKGAYVEDASDNSDNRITLEDVQLLSAGAGNTGLDHIILSALSGQTQTCDTSFQSAMAGKMTPHSILFALQRHLVRLHQAASLMDNGQSADEAMRALRPPVFAMQKSAFGSQLRLWSEPVLARAISSSLEVETQMKSTGMPAESLMGRFLLNLSSYAARKQR